MKIFILAILIFCLISPSSSSFNTRVDCAEVPPALWCDNVALKQECGFEKLCNRYERRMHNQTLKITLLYEGLCPDCQEYITGPLFDVYTHFKNYIDLELIPFGNAKVDYKTKKITCQHGEEECKVNKYQGCAINFLPKPFEFVYCLESRLMKGFKLEDSAKTCLEHVKADVHAVDLITHCFHGEQGNKFQLAYAKLTDEAFPEKHLHVPWLYFNDVSLHKAQNYQTILSDIICQWMVNDELPDVCYRENDVDYRDIEDDDDHDEDSDSEETEEHIEEHSEEPSEEEVSVERYHELTAEEEYE
uniref:Saposin A-type domain-containing protein n=1 Tax=Parastrongyloides trichosuri TaxID=131310 RepID=A0A0N4ZVU8_PARTI